MSRFTFWASAGLIAYTYVLFPIIVIVRGILRPRPVAAGPIEPFVSVVIAARNEEAVIGAKIDNLRRVDYPTDRIEAVVASDGSTDRTVQVIREAVSGSRGMDVRVLDLSAAGKAAAIAAAVQASRGEILVFSDANSMYERDAIRALVRPFADPTVGGVAGNQVYTTRTEIGEEAGELGYWSYDRLLKEYESRAGSAIGGTGAIYAIRRSLFRPIPPGVNDDFYLSAGVVHQGRRLVFAADAVAREAAEPGVENEFGRKVRLVSRAMRCVAAMPGLLDPRRHGFYALQLLSHKVMRWAMGVPLAGLLLASTGLARRQWFYRLSFIAQAVFYSLALVGVLGRGTPLAARPAVSIPLYFVMVNVAGLRAFWNLLRGRRVDHWQPIRARARVTDEAP